MGLEALTPTTYISGLTQSWPISSELKSQGDDHLRLIKGVLQNTFPNATGPMYFSSASVVSSNQVLSVANQGGLFLCGAEMTVTLPLGATLGAGWACDVMKYAVDTTGTTVISQNGNFFSSVGSVATVRVGCVLSPAKFIWSGSNWFCVKGGPPIGSTVNFDGPTIPPGHLLLDGSVYNTTTYAELAAALASGAVRDKRGRVEAGVDGGAGRLSASYFGTTPTLHAVGGLEYNTLTPATMPTHSHVNTAGVNDPGHDHTYNPYNGGAFQGGGGIGGVSNPGGGTTSHTTTGITVTMTNGSAGSGNSHANVQPTIVTQKIIRAC